MVNNEVRTGLINSNLKYLLLNNWSFKVSKKFTYHGVIGS